MHIAPMQPLSQLDVDVFRRGSTKASGHQHCRKEWMDTRLLAQGLDSPKQECIEPLQLHHLRCSAHVVMQRIASAVVAGIAELEQSAGSAKASG